ncbi:MAG: NUDIX domain-containing protein [Candidatus Pacebacteria bacterium]|nr:NUDIX domain-containing protein [Candidatus Paceibacterota bacterium]
MEYLDICDSEGNLTGQKELKTKVHELGLWHRSVHIWIVNSKGELLIQKRSPLVSNHPNEWDISSAGHVSAGERDIVSALREIKEEIGLKFLREDLIQIGTVKQTSKREGYINNEINPVYVVKIDLNPEKIQKQEEEVSEVKFIPHKELKVLVNKKDPSFVQHPEEYKLLFKYLKDNYQ